MADYGIKASKDDNDVFVADDKNLAFTSKAISPKLAAEGTLNFTATPQTQTVAHGLSYVPAFLVFKKLSGNSYWRLSSLPSDYVDSTELSVTSNNGDTAKYFIFYDPLQTISSATGSTGEDVGIKVSADDYDATKAGLENLVFTSELQSIMVVNTHSVSLSVPVQNTTYTTTVAHGMDYTPAFITTVKLEFGGGGVFYNFPYEFVLSDYSIWTSVDSTNFTCSAWIDFAGDIPNTVNYRIHVLNLGLE